LRALVTFEVLPEQVSRVLQLPGVQAFGDTGEPFRLELGADTRRIGGVETRRRDFAEYKRSFLIRRNGSALVWNGWLFWRCRGDQTGRPGRVTLTYQRNRANQQGVWLHFILELLARRDDSRRMLRIPFPDGTMFPAPAGRSALSTALLTAVLCVAFGAAPVGASAADAARGGVVSAGASWTGHSLEAAGPRDAASAIRIPKLSESDLGFRLDGRLDDAVWKQIPAYDRMGVAQPDNGTEPTWRTQTFLFYTERGLYVGAWNEQPADTRITRLVGRDQFGNADAYQIMLDSSGNGQYAYWFMVKLGDSVADGTLLPERKFSNNWDGPWQARTAQTEDGWTVEIFLPWVMLNMPESEDGMRQMRFLITRDIGKLQERWSWPVLPNTRPKFLSAFQPMALEGVEPSQEVSLFPYAAYAYDRARDTTEANAGVDVFWRPSAAFFLSGSVRPDFGQVEADNVVVNLSAFETFFPEKRLFFLENQTVFDTTGSGYPSGTTLLHTRRIGSSIGSRRGRPDFGNQDFDGFDTGKPVELTAAAKAVGQLGQSRFAWLGALEEDTRLAFDDRTGRASAPGRDFTVLRYQYDNTERGGRNALGWMGTLTRHPEREARTHVIDTHFQTVDGKWAVDSEWMYSRIDSADADEDSSGVGFSGNVKYNPRRGDQHIFQVEHYDDGIELNDLGFLRRNDFTSAFYEFWQQRQGLRRIRTFNWWGFVRADVNGDGKRVNGFASINPGVTFNNRWNVFANLRYAPSEWDDRNSRGNGIFRLDSRVGANVGFNSPGGGRFSFNGNQGYWTESLGGEQYFSNLFFNYSPVDRLRLTLGLGYTTRESWLIWQGGTEFKTFRSQQWSPRVGIGAFFTARQQLQLDLQWVGIKARENRRYEILGEGPLRQVALDPNDERATFAISDLVLQLRYRWQIAPLSDLFIVYNRGGGAPDASTADAFGDLLGDAFSDPSREALIIKLRYRFGLGG
tara:strand:- start:1476 stop:4379 length:2904 start_codon:yes stop_codon:yes gene_type:complete